ncbi:hypothetical protein ACFL1A_00285 [Patescibacteria group bacterium]
MAATILVLLIILLFLGFIEIPGIIVRNITLFQLNERAISLWDVMLFFLILWAIDVLPSPLREISAMIFLLWILSVLGVITITGMSNILIASVVIGLLISAFRK